MEFNLEEIYGSMGTLWLVSPDSGLQSPSEQTDHNMLATSIQKVQLDDVTI